MEIKIKTINIFSDNRGDLLPIEFNELPIVPKRIFTVNNVPENLIRGNHSHFETIQMLICISGEIEVILHDGVSEESHTIRKGEYILVDKLIWDSQKFLTKDSNLLLEISIFPQSIAL